jgi:hypothetical protein
VKWGLEGPKAGLPATERLVAGYPLLLGAKTGALESGEGRFIELRRWSLPLDPGREPFKVCGRCAPYAWFVDIEGEP